MRTLIARLGSSEFGHCFGGTSWRFAAPEGANPPPRLLLVLDAADERLQLSKVRAIPIFARLDGHTFHALQEYQFDEQDRHVRFDGEAWNTSDSSELPALQEQRLILVSPSAIEDELVADRHDVQDSFLGGSGFIRIGGEPVWLTDEPETTCRCGSERTLIATVGYEQYDAPSGFVLPDHPFFVGEMAYYFFVCEPCRSVGVVTQSS